MFYDGKQVFRQEGRRFFKGEDPIDRVEGQWKEVDVVRAGLLAQAVAIGKDAGDLPRFPYR